MKMVASIGVAALCSLALAAPAMGATFTVNDFGETSDQTPGDTFCDTDGGTDSAPCTLSAAIQEANSTAASDDIFFAAPGTHAITSTLSITQPVVIDGEGSVGGTVVDGGDSVRLFSTNNEPVTFKDIRLENGGVNDGTGAAISAGGTVTLNNATVTSTVVGGTSTVSGGAIVSSSTGATLTLTDSTVENTTVSIGNDDAAGAGIYSAGPLNLTDSTVSGNQIISTGSITEGAGIYAESAVDIDNSSITGNGGAVRGGGIFVAEFTPGAVSISNSTISGNAAGAGGGGGLLARKPVTVEGTTFASNSTTGVGGDDILAVSGAVTVGSTILASGTASCTATGVGSIGAAVSGSNIDIGTSCGFGVVNGNQENTDPLLAGLALNAPGATMTHALPTTSPALDMAGTCRGTDQRGVTRPQGSACDVGAFELEYRTLALTKAGTGSGTVTGTGIACGSDCSETAPNGTVNVLAATASAGSTFAGWTGCDAPAGNQCTQTLNGDEMVTATFTADPVTPPAGGGGTTTPTTKKKKCKKGRKLKKGKCVKKKRKK